MLFPSFPTDSIYKFLFISGIFLYAFSMYQTENRLIEGIRVAHKTDSLLNVTNTLKLEVSRLKYQTKNVELSFKNKLSKSQKKFLESKAELLQVKADSLDFYRDQISRKMRLIEKFEFVEKEQFQIYRYQMWFGMVLFAVGLVGWIYQQVLQDRILNLQAKLLSVELNDKLNE